MTTDLNRLDEYLSSGDSPDGCMMLSDLDGFLHGVACSPEMIPTHEWILRALGGSGKTVPDWVTKSIAALYADTYEGLTKDPPRVEPIFWRSKDGHVVATHWCEGFMEAVKLRASAWNVVVSTKEGSELFSPIIVHLLDERRNSQLSVHQDQLDESLAQAAEAIPTVVQAIYRLVSSKRAA